MGFNAVVHNTVANFNFKCCRLKVAQLVKLWYTFFFGKLRCNTAGFTPEFT